jgi:hypothetical protein
VSSTPADELAGGEGELVAAGAGVGGTYVADEAGGGGAGAGAGGGAETGAAAGVGAGGALSWPGLSGLW